MLNKEREQEIISILKTTNGFITVKELCNRLFASESSIRRDLKALEQHGIVKRSYGGATLINNSSSIATFGRRTRENTEAKREIAKKAARLVKDGDIIFLDQSTTAFYLASELMNFSSLTVVTNNIEIMMLLSDSALRVISSGGILSRDNRNCLIGGDAQKTFQNIYADICFFSVRAVSDEGLITDCCLEEINVRSSMLQNADKKVLLCDSSKFGSRASFKQCNMSDADILISEGEKSELFKDKIKVL